jgi:predicted nucleic acid-binding protein
MTSYVVDASVAAKWFFEEEFTDNALNLFTDEIRLHATDFILIELDSILWKRVRKNVISEIEAHKIRSSFRKLPISFHSSIELVNPSWEMAMKTGQTVYDCQYLSLSLILDCKLVTADRKLFMPISKGPFGKHVKWIGE